MSEHGPVGRPVEEVVAAVRDRDDGHDPETVREALDPVTEDGHVTRAAVEETVSDTSKIVATAETRVELAEIAHDEATAAAADVADRDIVAARLDRFEDRLDAVRDRAAALTDDLRAPVERLDDPDAVVDVALELREVATAAQGVARTADELAFDLEAFEAWLDSPEHRYDELEAEIDLVEESLGELSAAVDTIPDDTAAPAADWADATLRCRVLDLLVADLRTELDALGRWADEADLAFRDGLTDRVAAVEQEVETLGETLAERAEPPWRDRFGEDLTAFERELDGVEPPVDWERVQERLEERRTAAFDGQR